METRNCLNCGKMFTYLSGPPICQACQKLMDDKYREVKQYVYDHPGCGIQEVCDEMEVTQNQVRKWIREEKLTFAESSEIALNCEKCGRRILTGRFCQQCKNDMQNQLGGLYRKEAPKAPEKKTESNKMHFLDK